MNTPARRAQAQQRKLPYITQEELESPMPAVTIRVYGSCTVRGDHRKEVYTKDYEADIDVPRIHNLGHVKLQINRYIKRSIPNGIRARTYQVDHDVPATKAQKEYKVKDFISDQGIQENTRIKENYKRQRLAAKERLEAQQSEGYVPPDIEDTTQYDQDGLPPLKIQGFDELPEGAE